MSDPADRHAGSDDSPHEHADARAFPFRPPRKDPPLERAVPLAKELRRHGLSNARHDLVSAVTVAALAIPSAMAYAELAGLTAVAGLYALLAPTVVYALLASSRQLIVGPEGSLSALVGASVLALASAGSEEAATLAAALALLVAGCFVLACLARLGWVADYLSRPVLVGYIHGVAVVLVVGQLGKLLGVDVDERDPIPQLVEVGRNVGDASAATCLVSLLALGIMLPLRFLAPRVPAPLIVVVAGIAASAALALPTHGVAVVGQIQPGLPSLELPTPPLADALQLVPAAIGLFFVAFADGILTARSFAGRHDQHVSVNNELLAMGAANAAAGFSQGLPVGASGSRTAVNDAMGARTQLSGLLAAGVIAAVLLILTGPLADLPKAVLGAVIVSAAVGLVQPPVWRQLWDADHVEFAIAAVAAAGVVIVGVLEAIVFAAGLGIVDVVRRSARPHDAVLGWDAGLDRWADVSVHPNAVVAPGIVVYRLDDRLFFANASYFKARVHEAVRGSPTSTRIVVLDAEAIAHVDAAGLDALRDLTRRLRREGIELAVARMKTPTRRRLDEAGVTEEIGDEQFFATVRAAVRAAQGRAAVPTL